MPDLQLVNRCLEGDDTAWREIVLRYKSYVFNVAYRFTSRYDRAEDMTQEIFVKVFRNLSQFQSERGEFKSWVTVMARNLLIDHLRKEKKRWFKQGGSEELEKLDFEVGDPGPQGRLEKMERIRFVHQCLNALSPDLKEALLLREIEGMSYEEIADSLRVPLGTIKSRINRGRIELARIMNMKRMSSGMSWSQNADPRREHELPGI